MNLALCFNLLLLLDVVFLLSCQCWVCWVVVLLPVQFGWFSWFVPFCPLPVCYYFQPFSSSFYIFFYVALCGFTLSGKGQKHYIWETILLLSECCCRRLSFYSLRNEKQRNCSNNTTTWTWFFCIYFFIFFKFFIHMILFKDNWHNYFLWIFNQTVRHCLNNGPDLDC